MLVTHVDDMMWACDEEFQYCIDNILGKFIVDPEKIKEGQFRFCGKEVTHYESGSILVTCRSAAEQVGGIRYHNLGRRTDAPATEAETGQLRA